MKIEQNTDDKCSSSLTLSLKHCKKKNCTIFDYLSPNVLIKKKFCQTNVRNRETNGNPRGGRTGYVLVSHGEVGGVWFKIPFVVV